MSKKFVLLVVAFLILVIAIPLAMIKASAITSAKDTLSTVKASTAANHEIFFVSPSGGGANPRFTVTFSGFDVSAMTYQDVDFAIGTTSDCSSATFVEQPLVASETGDDYAVTVVSDSIHFDHTSGAIGIDPNRCLRLRFGTNATVGATGTHQIVNPTAGLKVISIGGAFFADSGDISVYIVGNDQVSISATVAQSLTFSLSSTTIGFGTLSASNVRFATNDNAGAVVPTTAHNLQASTNASNGYVITVKGSTLTSGANAITPIGASNTAIASGTEQFGVRFDASGGSGTVTAPYAASGYAYAADATTTSQVAASTVPSNTTTYNAAYIADISSLTEAGSYTTALTYVATANY